MIVMNKPFEKLEILPNETIELASIKLLCCDVDGVMTDGGLYYDDSGHSMIKFNVLDGIGLLNLKKFGVKTAVISMTNSPIITKRAQKLGIDFCHIGVEDKLTVMKKILRECDLSLNQVCHIADDINDLTLLEAIGVPVTVPNGVDNVKNVCRFVTKREGGAGAVREICDAIIKSKTTKQHGSPSRH